MVRVGSILIICQLIELSIEWQKNLDHDISYRTLKRPAALSTIYDPSVEFIFSERSSAKEERSRREAGKGMINGEFVCLGFSLTASFPFLHPCSLTLCFWYSFSGERPLMAFITMTPVPSDSNWPKFSWLPFIKWHHRLICSIHPSLVALSIMHHLKALCTWRWRPGRCQSSSQSLGVVPNPSPMNFV